MSVTPQQVIARYLEDQEKVRAIKSEADAKVAVIEEFQKKREDYLLTLKDPAIFGFMTNLYINGRDGKAVAEAKKKDLGLQMNEIERWLLHMLDSQKVTGIKTEFGTVFPTRKESVSVDDFDALLDFAVAKPIAEAMVEQLEYLHESFGNDKEGLLHDALTDRVREIVRASAHFEFLNKAVNKTAVLETLGEQDPKNGSRPNPAPPGVKYTAIRTVGVRKGKE